MKKIAISNGLELRMANFNDKFFIEELFHSTREALHKSEQEYDYVHNLIDMQLVMQTEDYGKKIPDAITFIVEKQRVKVGRVILDFGHNTVHILDLAFIKGARGKGYGKSVLQAIQHTAQQQSLPVTLIVEKQNISARILYKSLGFVLQDEDTVHDSLIWYPERDKIIVGA